MKRLLLALAALGLIYCTMAYFIGIKTDDFLKAALDQAATNSPNLSFTLRQKHQGVFRSGSVYTVDLALPAEPGKPDTGKTVSLDMAVDIAHGPIAFSKSFTPCLALADTTYSVNPTSSLEVRDFLAKFPELLQGTSRTRMGFNMAGTTLFTVPGANKTIRLENGTSLQLEWQPLTAAIGFDASLTAATLDARCPFLRIQDQKTSFTLSGLGFAADSKQFKGRLWTGKHRIGANSITVQPGASDAPVIVDDAFLNVELVPRGPVLDYAIDLGAIGKSGADQKKVPMSIGMVFHNLDVAALEDLQTVLQRQSSPAADSQNPNEADFIRIANAILARTPWLDLNGKAFEGGTAPVTIQASLKVENMTELPPSMLLALPKLRAQAKFNGTDQGVLDLLCLVVQDGAKRPAGDPGFRKQMAALIDQVLLQGFLAHKDGMLSSEVLWNGAALMVNGRRMQ